MDNGGKTLGADLMEQENWPYLNPDYYYNPLRSTPNLLMDAHNGYHSQYDPYLLRPQSLKLDLNYPAIHGNPFFLSRYSLYLPKTPGRINISQSQHLHSRFLEMPFSSEYIGERRVMKMSEHNHTSVVKDPTLATSSNTVPIPPDVITEILRRLPAKVVLRFRSVCKSWNSLTQDKHFISQYLNNRLDSNDLGVITLSWEHELSMRYFVNGYHKFDMTEVLTEERYQYQMSNSCDGLVCVYGRLSTYVVNPSIREVLVLPETKNKVRACVALGKNISAGEYKIVRLFLRRYNRTGCEIFNPGSGSWRVIQDAPCPIKYSSIPVVVNGFLHWEVDIPSTAEIAISFDIKNETFDVIMGPLGVGVCEYQGLTEMMGYLCVTATCGHMGFKDIWILKDYSKREWLRWRVCMLQMEPLILASYYMIPVMVRDGKMLWQYSGGRFQHYDLKNRKFLKPLCDPIKYAYANHYVCPYKETLISPIAVVDVSTVAL